MRLEAGVGTRRVLIAGAIMAAILLTFWTTSRYPSLGDKALMGGAIQLEDPLSFEALFPVEQSDPLAKKILLSTVNWIKTNLQGMVFGVLFGAAFLTLLGQLRRRAFRSKYLNTLLGFGMGAPLGVCVNCAAPIAQGIYKGGARLETSLAAMLASPTFNIIVLTMMFSLLPVYLVVSKIALSLVVIFIVVPMAVSGRHSSNLEGQATEQNAVACPIDIPVKGGGGLWTDFADTIRLFLENLWYIIRMTVPLMVLAGALGAAAAHLLPYDYLNDLNVSLFHLAAVALFSLFLPVPIAFDVVLVSALMAAGLPVAFVSVMLFSLGIFSIYAYFIVWRMVSFRFAAMLAAAIFVVSLAGGLIVERYHEWQTGKALDLLLSDTGIGFVGTASAAGLSEDAGGESPVTITKLRAFAPSSAEGKTPFRRIEAHHIGIDRPIEFAFEDMWAPFWTTNGSVSLADLDRDGDLDFVLARTDGGLRIFSNDGSGRFQPVELDLPAIDELKVVNAVPVDLDNDGWLDLFLATYADGNRVVWSQNGKFDNDRITETRNRDDARVAMAVSFGDVDQDGDLDLAVGNWASGWYRRLPGEESRNRIVFNEGALSGERFSELSAVPGETLSILLSDYINDEKLDLIVGNDFAIPDIFYVGREDGEFENIGAEQGIIENSTRTTMSIKTADLNNDLVPEIYTAQIAGQAEDASERINFQENALYCSEIERDADRRECQKNVDIRTWYRPGRKLDPSLAVNCLSLSGDDIEACKAMMVKDLAIQNNRPDICLYIKPHQPLARKFCAVHFLPSPEIEDIPLADYVPQIPGRNVLLERDGEGRFRDGTEEAGLELGGWSWDNKIADFDNDGLQDIYVVNGWWPRQGASPSNVYFSNLGEMKFIDATEQFGLEDYFVMPAAAAGDIDNDGDLDMIAAPINAPMVAYINNAQDRNSVRIGIVDEIGNRFGVGSKITIKYGGPEKHNQMRELQLGGGFNSFDPIEAHFGLGPETQIDEIEIRWSTGEHSRLEGPFAANAVYQIERRRHD
ncbi:FG-GAP-like repeat-containing protein [Nitratireductor sp. XY-223]|uniref:FG-GAP-like repeat-containing protein n=1 Tax=Nitratireductor sp. XY-223 TaxID=2561926 RepID=UPI0010A9DF44|nr:FG-GAP-like repeat-containing protein [Nitratireductor sp. XY-223]